jgi:hypothetical protein
MNMIHFRTLHSRRLLAALFLVAGGLWTSVYAQTITPASVEASLDPGASLNVDKTVGTPVIPPRPDICFLADTTGSMGAALANVIANATTIMNNVLAVQADAQFCAAEYRDAGDSFAFALNQAITGNTAAVQAAIGTWNADEGGDTPEAQLNALTQLSNPAIAGWRADSTRIIVWFGDNPGHDPSLGATLASTITALTGEEIRVIAVPVATPFNLGLDFSGQATAIVAATGGVLITTVDPEDVTEAILLGLTNLPVDVSMTSNCAATTGGAILTSFVPDVQTVTSGTNALFDETITVGPAAIQGQTYTCQDWALLDGSPMNDAAGNLVVEEKTIHVNDVTPPTAACVEGPNPAGNVPQARKTNEDGFFTLLGDDNVAVASIVVCDDASSFCTEPFSSGDTVKITQTPGGTAREVRPGPGGIAAHIFLNGDAVLTVTDESDLVTTASCLVPPAPK